MLGQLLPANPAEAAELLNLVKTFGLGLTVLFLWLWHEVAQRKEAQADLKTQRAQSEANEKKHTQDLLDISKENLSTLSSLAELVQAVSPSVTASSQQISKDVERAFSDLKGHVTTQCQLLESAIRNQRTP